MLRLRELRRERGEREGRRVTLEEVASAIGTDAGTLSLLERDKQWPTRSQFLALSQYYKIGVHELMESYSPTPPQMREIEQKLISLDRDTAQKRLDAILALLDGA